MDNDSALSIRVNWHFDRPKASKGAELRQGRFCKDYRVGADIEAANQGSLSYFLRLCVFLAGLCLALILWPIAAKAATSPLVMPGQAGDAPKAAIPEDLTLEEIPALLATMTDDQAREITALNEALQELEQLDPRQSLVVELRYFGGFSVPETAEALSVSPATVKRDWAVARAWLQDYLHPPGA